MTQKWVATLFIHLKCCSGFWFANVESWNAFSCVATVGAQVQVVWQGCKDTVSPLAQTHPGLCVWAVRFGWAKDVIIHRTNETNWFITCHRSNILFLSLFSPWWIQVAGSIQTHTCWMKDGHSALACVRLLYLRGDMRAGRLIMAVVARGAVGTPWGLNEPRRSLVTEQIKPTDSLFAGLNLIYFCPYTRLKKRRPLKMFFSFSILKLGKQK
jgi:hypothetical protein